MSLCGSHFPSSTLSGLPSKFSSSHFHKILCFKLLNTFRNTLSLSAGISFDCRLEPRLKNTTPCFAPSKNFLMLWNITRKMQLNNNNHTIVCISVLRTIRACCIRAIIDVFSKNSYYI